MIEDRPWKMDLFPGNLTLSTEVRKLYTENHSNNPAHKKVKFIMSVIQTKMIMHKKRQEVGEYGRTLKKYAKWKKPTTKDRLLYDAICMRDPE